MILSAQRVRAHDGEQGINCYHYVHGGHGVARPEDWFTQKTTLVWQDRPLPRSGNRVRSFVDVAAPDDSSWEEVFRALELMLRLPDMPEAFSAADTTVAFKLDMDGALRPRWRHEVLSLLSHLQSVHP